MAYQPNVIAEFNRALRDTRASPKVKKALFEAGIVESGLKNLNYGDRDSLGALQQRPSQGWRNARNPYMAALDFIKRAQPIAQKYGTAGQLAQAVQRSAFPGRYDQQGGAASSILKGSPRGAGGALPQMQQTSVPIRAGGGVDPRQQIALSLLGLGNLGGSYGDTGDSLTNTLIAAAQAQQMPRAPTGQMPSYGGTTRTPAAKGVSNFEGHQVAAWIKPYLVKARQMGWKGTVNSGYRSRAEQTRIYNSGVRPAAKPGTSNHEGTQFPRGAVDVSDAPTLAKILRQLGAPLQWAGAKDPVHFSHPHNGSY